MASCRTNILTSLLLASLLCSSGCGQSDSGPATTSQRPTPLRHRAQAVTCDRDRAPSATARLPDLPPGYGVPECRLDSDCVAGTNGRCSWQPEASYFCTYDECFVDTDCPTGRACICNGVLGNNQCVPANCRVDSDCGRDGFCSPMSMCLGRPWLQGVYCHAGQDECTNDEDCGEGEYCGYHPPAALTEAWKCLPAGCVQ